MPNSWLILILIVLAIGGFVYARQRALAGAGGDARNLHSLPVFYGAHAAIYAAVPAVVLLLLWTAFQPTVLEMRSAGQLSDEIVEQYTTRDLAFSDVVKIADGLDLAVREGVLTSEAAGRMRTEFTDVRDRLGEVGIALGANVQPEILLVAQEYRDRSRFGDIIKTVLVLALAGAGLAFAILRTTPEFRSRNSVEAATRMVLIFAAFIAVLTTVGIFLSLIFNTVAFFQLYNWTDFLFGTTWSPSFGGGSQLGVLPLLWGTMYISLIALCVAVPIGLFAAIYLSEYASPWVRSVVKPALEVLAGIPSIVYGLFALLTVGPFLLDVFGPGPAADGGMFGLDWMNNARSVLTAGLVMGIMLIPFVSSLSDDIINAVPQATRDGSLGLGATPSETIRQVVLPAALPGIVGAIILAASRAIGETMLVVFGAGAAGALALSPLEAMTTVTAKIVSQLTGDADFSSPEVLVAYALGTLLFVVTLGLNLLAQYIVKTYREQYE
ncbi:MAG: phosphate ABC transporter permease subunit PstC [Pseudomonadota bacterium]